MYRVYVGNTQKQMTAPGMAVIATYMKIDCSCPLSCATCLGLGSCWLTCAWKVMCDTSPGFAHASYAWSTPLEPLDSKCLSILWLLDAFNTFSCRNHVMCGVVALGNSVNMPFNIET